MPRRQRPWPLVALPGLVLVAFVSLAARQPSARLSVAWIWSGAVTPSSVVLKAKVRGAGRDLHLLYATDEKMQGARRAPLEGGVVPTEIGIARFAVDGLTPNSRYYYAVADGDNRTDALGEFRTFAQGPMSFEFGVASCAGGSLFSSVSNHPIFTTLEDRRPLFFIHTGDFHYLNINRNDVQLFRRAFDLVLGQRRQASFYRRTPLVYIWDDHDYGPNDSDRRSPARDAARAAYTEHVPHYPLVLEDGRVATIQQEFTVGRARFLVTDLRSERDPVGEPDGPSKSLMGERQREWFGAALERAASDGSAIVFWVNTVPWITREGDRDDGWEPYAWERRWVADRIDALGLTPRLIVLSGDAHMVAIDDGTNSNYSSGAKPGTRAFPVFQAAPLDRSATIKGGPYSHGISTLNNQFGWVDVDDDGTVVRVELSGHDGAGRDLRGLRLRIECRDGACTPIR